MSRARSVPSMMWFVRCTLPHSQAMTGTQLVEPWCNKLLVIAHIGEKNEGEHIHLAITLPSAITKQTIDLKLQKIFGVKGVNYSSKPWDGSDSVLSYMFHETGAPVLSRKEYSDENITQYVEMNAKVQKVIEVNKQRAPGRKVDAAVEIFKQEEGMPSRTDIGKHFIRMIRTGEMYEPGDFKLKQMIEEVIIKCLPENEVENYAESRIHDLFRIR